MLEKIQKFLDRFESRASLIFMLSQGGGVLVIGGLSAYFASISNWLDVYGPIGWWFAALTAILLSVFIVYIISVIRLKFTLASANSKWKKDVDYINPLDNEFTKRRINFIDLVHPVHRSISGKKFTDCELIGPARVC